ncbi:MAG: hypothetical protein WCK90_03890 [archaeon]
MCKKWTNTIAALIVILLTLWPGLIGGAVASKWIIAIAGLVIIIVSWMCGCDCCSVEEKPAKAKRKR